MVEKCVLMADRTICYQCLCTILVEIQKNKITSKQFREKLISELTNIDLEMTVEKNPKLSEIIDLFNKKIAEGALFAR